MQKRADDLGYKHQEILLFRLRLFPKGKAKGNISYISKSINGGAVK